MYERRDFSEVMLELAQRLGLEDKYYEAINGTIPVRYGGELSEENRLKAGEHYTWEEIGDRLIRDRFGPDKGLDYAKRDGVITWPKKLEEVYWKWFLDVRVPIYFEFFPIGGQKSKKIAEQFGAGDIIDYSRFTALPDWYPCPTHQYDGTEYDMYVFYWRPVMHCNSLTMQNPWLDEVAEQDGFVYTIQMHSETARGKGIADLDAVWLENPEGHRVQGRVRLTEGIEPQHLAIAACAGHWTPHQPIAKGKGVFFNDLVEADVAHTDPLTLGQDICVKVKVYKA
jgi:anaerobic selenocysteine-containing dehydrogenase